MERRKEDVEKREAALKEQKKIEEEVVSTGTLPRGEAGSKDERRAMFR